MNAGNWWRNELGAVTVDWVVLTGGLVALAVTISLAIGQGSGALGVATSDSIQAAQVVPLGTVGYSD